MRFKPGDVVRCRPEMRERIEVMGAEYFEGERYIVELATPWEEGSLPWYYVSETCLLYPEDCLDSSRDYIFEEVM